MLVLAPNQVVEKYPYTLGDLRKSYPNTSFPKNPLPESLAEFGVYPVQRVEEPSIDPLTQNVFERTPVLIGGKWTQVFEVVQASAEEIEERKANKNNEIRERRLEEYKRFSDPLFFKWQRDEGTKEEWVWAVQQIKELYPYVE
jgi:hypothetical protein